MIKTAEHNFAAKPTSLRKGPRLLSGCTKMPWRRGGSVPSLATEIYSTPRDRNLLVAITIVSAFQASSRFLHRRFTLLDTYMIETGEC